MATYTSNQRLEEIAHQMHTMHEDLKLLEIRMKRLGLDLNPFAEEIRSIRHHMQEVMVEDLGKEPRFF